MEGGSVRQQQELLTLTTGVVPGRVVVVVVAVWAERRGEGVGSSEDVGRVVEWGGVETAVDWETAEDLLFPPPPFFPPFAVIGISTSCRECKHCHTS